MLSIRLKTVRKEKKLTQADLASLLNISSSTISMYEQGRRDPDTETIKFLSSYFNVSTDWLLGISEIRNPYKYNNDTSIETYHYFDQHSLCKEDQKKVEEYIEFLSQKANSNSV